MKMRTKKEITERVIELDNLGWIHRHYMHRLKEENPEKVEASFGSTPTEKKYGKYEYMTDFELGELYGGLKALCWARGEEWGSTDVF